MTLEKAIYETKEHMNTCKPDSEEYEILQILLTCAEMVRDKGTKLACPYSHYKYFNINVLLSGGNN